MRFPPSPRRGLPLLLMLALLPGCSHSVSRSAVAVGQISHALPAGVSAVQGDPAYPEAVRRFARHDFRGAQGALETIGRESRLAHDNDAQRFLAYQQILCRHALDPRVSLNPPPVAAPTRTLPAAQADCGPRALLLLCQNAGIKANLAGLRQEAETTTRGTTLQGLALAARRHGWKASGVLVDPQALAQLDKPAVAWVDGSHYVAVLAVKNGQATIHDPNSAQEETLPTSLLWSRCGGILLTLAR